MTRLVYIGGFGQSGTTLSEYLLTANPDVVACGEIANGFEGQSGRELMCSCGKLAGDCPTWGVFARGSNASLNHDALVLTLLEHVKGKYAILCDSSKTAWGSITAPFRLRRLLGPAVLLAAPGERSESGMLVDNTPASHQNAQKEKADADRAGSVAADPSVLSNRDRLVGRQSQLRDFWLALPESILAPPLYLRLLYEDVASSPREALRALFEAVSPDLPLRLAKPEAKDSRHQIYGNRMRRQRLLFADVRLDDGWKSEMAPRYRRLAGALS